MEKRLEIIAIDHGWSNIKTVNTVFSTAVNQIANEPGIFDNILQYEGKFYSVGGKRLEVKDNKVTDESFYLLTLAAMAKALKIRGKNSADDFLSVEHICGKADRCLCSGLSDLMKQMEEIFKNQEVEK